MEADDAQLLRRWQGGDREAGDLLVRRHIRDVYRFLAARASDRVEDAVQRTFEICLKKADQFRGEGSFRAYLFSIAHNQALNVRRDWRRDAAAQAFGELPDLRDDATSPTGAMARKQRTKVLLRGLAALPDELRHAVELFYWADLPTKEIGEVLGIPRSTVTSRLFRARELLRVQLTSMDVNEAVRASTITHIEQHLAPSDDTED